MKMIGWLNALSAVREMMEEYQPEKGVFQRDLIELVKSAYEFQIFPVIPPGATAPPILTFGAGRFVSDKDAFGINQLLMSQDGDIAVTVTTDQADLVLDDLASRLDETLGFRLRSINRPKRHVSNIVVEFDKGLEDYITNISQMAVVINELRPGGVNFNIKRLVFGSENSIETEDLLGKIENSEFVIERRAGIPFQANRYFCSAPMSTGDHIRALERIEAIVRNKTV